MNTHSLFQAPDKCMGLKHGGAIAIGYMPAAITFGFLAQSTGLTFTEAVMMSTFVFAGAAQYTALGLISAGTGALEIIITTLVLNIRHLLMSASLNEKAEPAHPVIKAGYAFGITDEVFAVTSTNNRPISSSYIYSVFLTAYVSWVAFTAAGHSAGDLLPAFLQTSLSFAIYALFLALLLPPLKKSRKVLALAGTAALFHGILYSFLPEGWAIITAAAAASILIEWAAPNRIRKEQTAYE